MVHLAQQSPAATDDNILPARRLCRKSAADMQPLPA